MNIILLVIILRVHRIRFLENKGLEIMEWLMFYLFNKKWILMMEFFFRASWVINSNWKIIFFKWISLETYGN